MRKEELNGMESTVKTNVRACKCYQDGAYIPKGKGIGIWIPSRGQRYLCKMCAYDVQMVDGFYHESAMNGFNEILGTPKKGGLQATTIGVEIEGKKVEGISDYTLRMYLRKLGDPERDCTVDHETPSKPMQGLKTLSKFLEYVERGGFLPCFNNEDCGAHIHVFCNDIDYIRRYYHSIFLPLNDWIKELPFQERIAIFGSDFRHYAQPIDICSDPMEHTNIFNAQHDETLEFRLPRITGKVQYMEVVKFWREVGYTINTWDFQKENSSNNIRRIQAKLCGEKLVEIARKHFKYK